MLEPIALPANQPGDRFYRGGARIAAFRGVPSAGHRCPEDWVASTTPLFGHRRLGLSHLPDGSLLVDAVAADPAGWLGAAHLDAFGPATELLVKLLDAGERLPVHAHPHAGFSASNLGCAHGKAEAWVLLGDADVHLGFTREVGPAELQQWVDRQEIEPMLECMHAVSLHAGDTIFVPPGLPHALGEGSFLIELQEPTDFSVLLEWRDFAIDGRKDGHLQLGFELALQCVDRSAWSSGAIDDLIIRSGSTAADTGFDLLPPAAVPYFRAERHSGTRNAGIATGFSVLVAVAGAGLLSTSRGSQSIARGSTVVVPFAAGELELSGDVEVICCRPPLPPSPDRPQPPSAADTALQPIDRMML